MDELWRLVPWWTGAAGEVLAAGELLLEAAAAGTAVVQWYSMAPDALILGPRQHGATGVDLALCRAQGVGVYVRRSGGTAVLADRSLLNLDVALPPAHPLAPRDVTRAYAWLGQALAAGLRHLGVPASALSTAEVRAEAELRGGSFTAASVACFGGLSPYEVVAEGRKVVGLSQIRRRQGTLLQAGLPLRWDPARLAALLGGEPLWTAALATELASFTAGLDRWGLDLAALPRVVAALTSEIAAASGARFHEAPWAAAEACAIRERAARHYAPVPEPSPP